MQKEMEPTGSGKECQCQPRLKVVESKLDNVIKFLKDEYGVDMSSSGPGGQESKISVAENENVVKIEGRSLNEQIEMEVDYNSSVIPLDFVPTASTAFPVTPANIAGESQTIQINDTQTEGFIAQDIQTSSESDAVAVIDQEMQSETDSGRGQVIFDETQANSFNGKAVIDKETQTASNEDKETQTGSNEDKETQTGSNEDKETQTGFNEDEGTPEAIIDNETQTGSNEDKGKPEAIMDKETTGSNEGEADIDKGMSQTNSSEDDAEAVVITHGNDAAEFNSSQDDVIIEESENLDFNISGCSVVPEENLISSCEAAGRNSSNVILEKDPVLTIFKCDWANCGLQFKAKNFLKMHEKVHVTVTREKTRDTNSEDKSRKRGKTIKCTWPNCDKSLDGFAKFDHHLKTHYQNDYYNCTWPNCTKTFSRNCNLKMHEKTHENFKSGKKQQNTKVTKEAGSKPNKNRKSVILEPKNTKENDSKIKTRRRRDYKHLESLRIGKASGLYIYKCGVCNKAFKVCNELIIHLQTHTG